MEVLRIEIVWAAMSYLDRASRPVVIMYLGLRCLLPGNTNDEPASWKQFVHEHEVTVRKHFGLLTVFTSHRVVIQQYDLLALATERRDLIQHVDEPGNEWAVLRDGAPDVIRPAAWENLRSREREAMTWQDWRDAFRDRYDELTVEISQVALP